MSEKIIGYLLVFAGLGFILGAGFNIYQIVTRQAKPVRLFNFDSVTIDTNKIVAQPEQVNMEGLTAEQQKVAQQILDTQEKQKGATLTILPGDVLTDTSNLFAHIILMGFLATIGSRISGIGVLMVRPIVVKLKQKNEEDDNNWPSKNLFNNRK
jgi:hypothetical protein